MTEQKKSVLGIVESVEDATVGETGIVQFAANARTVSAFRVGLGVAAA